MNDNTRLACFELWEGEGLSKWGYSAAHELSSGGGDVQYFSVCSKGMILCIAVADLAGHGVRASVTAENMRRVPRHTNSWDQSRLTQGLNNAFVRETSPGRFATAVFLGFYLETGELMFSSAGHLSVLWYRAKENSWELLLKSTPYSVDVADLPLGVIPATTYRQTAIQLDEGDVFVLYTDGITEAYR